LDPLSLAVGQGVSVLADCKPECFWPDAVAVPAAFPGNVAAHSAFKFRPLETFCVQPLSMV
jgi:hypothetical protein